MEASGHVLPQVKAHGTHSVRGYRFPERSWTFQRRVKLLTCTEIQTSGCKARTTKIMQGESKIWVLQELLSDNTQHS